MDLTQLLVALETEVGRVNHAAQVAAGERDAAVEQVATLTAERDAVTADRDRLAGELTAAGRLNDDLLAAAQLAESDRDRLAAEVAALRDRHEGRVPAGPVRELIADVVALAAATGDPAVAGRWEVMAAAAMGKVSEAEPGGGVRRDDPMIAKLRALVVADKLLDAATLDAKLAAIGLA